MRTSTAGLGLGVLSAVTFGTAGTFATALIDSGWSPAAAVTARVGVAAVVLTLPALLKLRGRWRLLRRSWFSVLAFSLLGVAGAQLFYFNAVQHLSIGIAMLLEYSGTLLVVAWAWARYGQRPKRRTVAGAGVAVVGMAFVLGLTGSQHLDAIGVLWGLAAAVGVAGYFIISSRTDDALPPIVTAWAGMVLATVTLALCSVSGLLPWRTSTADTRLAGHETSWLVPVLGVSLIAAVAAYISGIAAARRLGARLASFVGLAEVLSSVLWAWLALGQRPNAMQAVGGILVLGGIALVRADEDVLDAQDPAPADVLLASP